MSVPCIFLPDENEQGCLVERERRFREHRPDIRPWERNPCETCKPGRRRAEAHIPPEPDEEEEMPQKMTTKDRVLAAIQRRGTVAPTLLMQGTKASADQLKVIVRELEEAGKIKSWPYRTRQGMSAIYTPAGAPDPRTEEMREEKTPTPPSDATVPTKKPLSVNRKASTTREPVVRNRKEVAPSNGAFAAVIAELEARRTKALDRVEQIDTAIATLRALA